MKGTYNNMPPAIVTSSSHLPASPDVGNRKDSTKMLYEDKPARTEWGGNGDVEPSVSIQQSGVSAIRCEILEGGGRLAEYDRGWGEG